MVDLPIHFFKFIPPGFKFDLSIPESFLANLKEWRCKTAILKRGCHKWAVHITDGGVFGDGWRKFVIDNGVEELDFIVFKHQGNMVFDFFVFDQSTCERKYPKQESQTEPGTLHKHKRSKIVHKRKLTDYSSQSKDKFRPGDSFVTIMTIYCIERARLNVPIKFARSNGLITKRTHTQITLVDEAKRIWPATLHNNAEQIRLTSWHQLIVENDLKVGDTCMFELVKAGEKPVFNFYARGKKPTHKHIQVKKKTSSTCFFTSTLKPYSFTKSSLHLPAEFSISNNLRKGKMILRDDKGRSWEVQLNKYGKDRFCVGSGLRDFLFANRLREGDAYKFELIENEKNKPPVVNFSLKVGMDSLTGLRHSCHKLKTQETINSQSTGSRVDCAVKVDSTLSGIEDRPYYIGTLKSYHIEKSILYLPHKFARKNGLLNKEEMILKNVDERSWTVEIKSYMNKYRHAVLRRGWKEFFVANGLKEGDMFKLELVSNGEIPVANFYLQNS